MASVGGLAGALGILAAVACSGGPAPTRAATEAEPPPTREAIGEPAAIAPDPPVARVAALDVAVGERVSCALLDHGEVRCWGTNTDGRAGLGAVAYSPSPMRVEGLPPVRAITLGDRHGCAIDETGGVHCWGANGYGELGDGTTASRSVAAPVAGVSDVVEIAAASWHTCARTAAGEVHCWGRSLLAGGGTRRDRLRPARIAGLGEVVDIEVGSQASCAIRGDRSMLCWGYNAHGLFGARPGPFAAPTRALAEIAVRRIALGPRHFCATLDDGTMVCAGSDEGGELVDQEIPDDARCERDGDEVACSFADPVDAARAAAFAEHRAAVRDPATGTRPPIDVEPPAVRTEVRRFPLRRGVGPARWTGREVAAAGRLRGRTCFVGDRGVECYGRSIHSRGEDWAHRTRAPIAGTRDAIALDVDDSHGCAVLADRSVACWGSNDSGELGDGTLDARVHAATVRF